MKGSIYWSQLANGNQDGDYTAPRVSFPLLLIAFSLFLQMPSNFYRSLFRPSSEVKIEEKKETLQSTSENTFAITLDLTDSVFSKECLR